MGKNDKISIGRPETRIPHSSKQVYRILANEEFREYTRVDSSLLARYATHLFTSPSAYLTAWFARQTTIPVQFFGKRLRVHRGKLWRNLRVGRWHCGLRLGEFAKTRTLAVFRQKAIRKKRPVQILTTAQLTHAANIEKIRQIKAGQRKRGIGKYALAFEQQFTAVS